MVATSALYICLYLSFSMHEKAQVRSYNQDQGNRHLQDVGFVLAFCQEQRSLTANCQALWTT